MIDQFFQNGAIISTGPDQILIGYGPRIWSVGPESTNKPYFYSPDYFLTVKQPWFTHEHWKSLSLTDAVNELFSQKKPGKFQWDCAFEGIFRNAFENIKQRISKKELYKAVPYVLTSTPSKMTSEQLKHALMNVVAYAKGQPVHIYGFWDETSGILGATPEILFRLHHKQLATMACAGTHRPGQAGSPQDLLHNPKEMLEHKIVIDAITESLVPFGSIEVGKTTVLQLPKLAHLMTPISAKLTHDTSFQALAEALHPTPALGAFPKKEGMQWLKDYQIKVPRKRYGAPFGVVTQDNALCLVSIRNAQWDEHGISIGAGCGIVADSQVDQEWQEILAKTEATKQLLGL